MDDFEQDAVQRDMLWGHVEKASRRLLAILSNRKVLEKYVKTVMELGVLEESIPVDCRGLVKWTEAMANEAYDTHVRKQLMEERLQASAKGSSDDAVALAWVSMFLKLHAIVHYDRIACVSRLERSNESRSMTMMMKPLGSQPFSRSMRSSLHTNHQISSG